MLQLMVQYGYLTLATYLGVYVMTLASLYALVRLGAIEGPDVNAFINAMHIKKALYAPDIAIPPVMLQFGTAWVLTKMTEPVRLAVTVVAIPIIARRAPPAFLRFFSRGKLGARAPTASAKPPPPA